MKKILTTLVLSLFFTSSQSEARLGGAATTKDDACLPITMPSNDVILNSPKKVFAHYFYPFPLSIDNKYYAVDYYAVNYLSPTGENNKWIDHGGFLRTRPLPINSGLADSYSLENMKHEIRAAIKRGINGFTFDIMALSNIDDGGVLDKMLAAAAAVDSRFKIVLMPDMTALAGGLSDVQAIVEKYATNSGVYHLDDGRVVLMPFYAEGKTPTEWQGLLTTLSGEGISVAFWPTFLSLGQTRVNTYGPISYGVGTFPEATINSPNATNSAMAHAAGLKYLAGVDPQQFRPKSFVFWESGGSAAYRSAWTTAISGNSDAIQLVTWNDYGESSQVSPFMGSDGAVGNGYYNLTGYYASWFLTGAQPYITHDVIYYFYRREPTNAAMPAQTQTFTLAVGTATQTQELLAFLKSPATLSISVNGSQTSTVDAAAGVQSLTQTLVAGSPVYTLSRSGVTAITLNGDITAVGVGGLPSGIGDLTYYSNSASKDLVCGNTSVSLN